MPQIGILGSGQLSMMLAQSAQKLSLDCWTWGGSPTDPAVLEIGKEKWMPSDQLKAFLKRSDFVLFENEFVDISELRILEKELRGEGWNGVFRPSLGAIEFLQDKINQKSLFDQLKIPTAKWKLVDQFDPQSLARGFQTGCVLKWTKFGYDGYGTLLLRNDELAELAKGGLGDLHKRIEKFMDLAKSRGARVIVEEKIKFKRELAVVGCVAENSIEHYPLVWVESMNKACYLVRGKAVQLGVKSEVEKWTHSCLESISQEMNRSNPFVGAFAIEFFETEEGELYANEIAPRVHNTAHYSMAASVCSQFENHIRACIFGSVAPHQTCDYFGMINFLASQDPTMCKGQSSAPQVKDLPKDMQLIWYRKGEARPGRKMGHLNWIARSKGDLEKLTKKAIEVELQWRGLETLK